MTKISRRYLLAAGMGLGPARAIAQTAPFPARPIRILVGFAAGLRRGAGALQIGEFQRAA